MCPTNWKLCLTSLLPHTRVQNFGHHKKIPPHIQRQPNTIASSTPNQPAKQPSNQPSIHSVRQTRTDTISHIQDGCYRHKQPSQVSCPVLGSLI